jgi:hypothetical protein
MRRRRRLAVEDTDLLEEPSHLPRGARRASAQSVDSGSR